MEGAALRKEQDVFVTHHAAAQFARRVRPDLSREEARTYLIGAVRDARSTGRRTEVGHAIWEIPGALLVTKRDPAYGDVLVTILAPDMPGIRAERLAEAEDEVVAAARRAGARFPATNNLPRMTPRRARGNKRRRK